ncbi:hypothetical protein WEU38_10305 [Cyanobacterium aponinum AL20118]|uniref:Uncharacterized protein n=1 Tax=Cyanobacterium aponinum AL20115 TaxID=3090662 RepID=A0AAF1C5J5_9CHRO|nr:hypothetical protein [Cyanobacterium aponinum]WPF87204.1 hypothetical protein SAY89_10325 [Cyanobacterium aponinum AL20115]
MNNQEPKIPNPEKIAETLKKARRACREMELAGLELDEAIALLEQENRNQRKQYLNKVLS